MGGKGRRRREKNFKAAHGGDNRLPPPPKLKELEMLPSKLRLLMHFKNASSDNPEGQTGERVERSQMNNKQKAGDFKEKNSKDLKSISNEQKDKDTDKTSDTDEVKEKKKRKRKVPMDLRFQLDELVSKTRKKKRKEFLDAKKKKPKKDNTDDEIRNFPGREEIKFGDIVKAPPKISFPKAKSLMDASKERLRLMDASKERLRLNAIEEYRNRRNWDSRPGIQIPTSQNPTS